MTERLRPWSRDSSHQLISVLLFPRSTSARMKLRSVSTLPGSASQTKSAIGLLNEVKEQQIIA